MKPTRGVQPAGCASPWAGAVRSRLPPSVGLAGRLPRAEAPSFDTTRRIGVFC